MPSQPTQNEMKHTPEPWAAGVYNIFKEEDNSTLRLLFTAHATTIATAMADVRRAVSCVNFLSGHDLTSAKVLSGEEVAKATKTISDAASLLQSLKQHGMADALRNVLSAFSPAPNHTEGK